jgi:hypothetical protein
MSKRCHSSRLPANEKNSWVLKKIHVGQHGKKNRQRLAVNACMDRFVF